MRSTKILTVAIGALIISAASAQAQQSSAWQAAADAFAKQYERRATQSAADDDEAYPSGSRFQESLRAATQAATKTLERENRQRIERGLQEIEERRQYVESMKRQYTPVPRRDPVIDRMPTYPQLPTPRRPDAPPVPAKKYGCGPFVRGVCEIAR
jgi:hypothetical protein